MVRGDDGGAEGLHDEGSVCPETLQVVLTWWEFLSQSKQEVTCSTAIDGSSDRRQSQGSGVQAETPIQTPLQWPKRGQ